MLTALKDKIQGKVPLGSKRSDHWPATRSIHLRKNPNCALCGGTKKIEVHHIRPFHLDPSLELDPNNLITLCEAGDGGINCHLAFGHLGNFKQENPNVVVDAANYAAKRQAASEPKR